MEGRKGQKPKSAINKSSYTKATRATINKPNKETKPTSFTHCREPCTLENHPFVTYQQQGEILVQHTEGGDGAKAEEMPFQESDGSRKGGLQRNYLYCELCATKDKIVNQVYLLRVHWISRPLTLHTNTGSSHMKYKGYLGSHHFWIDCFDITNAMFVNHWRASTMWYKTVRNVGAHWYERLLKVKCCYRGA